MKLVIVRGIPLNGLGYLPPTSLMTDYATLSNLNSTKSDLTSKVNNYWTTIYPVGSEYITSTNTNPSAILGGTWSLIDQNYAEQYYSTSDQTASTDFFTMDTTNTTSYGLRIYITGEWMQVLIAIVPKVNVEDTALTYGTINLDYLGLTTMGYCRNCGWADADEAVVMGYCNTAGEIKTYDVVKYEQNGTLAAGNTFYMFFMINLKDSYRKADTAIQYVWQRTA